MNLEKELAEMQKMTVGQLRERYEDVFGETTRSGNRQWMIKRIAWRLQANAYGGLSERAKARAAELANDADVRLTAPKTLSFPQNATRANVVAGTEYRRVYKGKELVVRVDGDGFVFEGQRFKSLSAVAKHITGSHCSGQAFFKTKGPK